MRNYRSSKGPFQERPYFKSGEIDEICTAELRNAGLLPDSPSPVRIERFIEKRFGVTPEYDDLPDGVLGFTRFSENGVEGIVVSRALAEDQSAASERRISTTLAHEAGHGLLHANLFATLTDAARLFGCELDPIDPKILCRDDMVNTAQRPKYDGRWWEFQANQTIGALLLPRGLIHQCLAALFDTSGCFGMHHLRPDKRGQAVQLLASTFEVNPAVSRIRLDQLFPLDNSAQLTF